jgi:predicted phage terminase large subunit-like protein
MIEVIKIKTKSNKKNNTKNNTKNNSFHNFEILIENASSGRQLIQELKSSMPIIEINPRKSKVERFSSCVFLFESGKVLLPKTSFYYEKYFKFMKDFEKELFSFPDSKYSDCVDSVSQFLNYQFNIDNIDTENQSNHSKKNKKPKIVIS